MIHLRRWLLPGVILALFTAAVIFPATEFGRQWLLQRAVTVVADLGYDLTYSAASGNPWFGVELSEVTLTGPGIDIDAGRLAVDYFLPSLITGELPLSLELEGLRGSVDPAGMTVLGNGGGDAPVSPRLRELSIRDVAVEIQGSPWTLPALDIEDVSVERLQDSLRFAISVSSDQGRADLAGTLDLVPLRLDLEILSADARLARQWWEGVDSGTVTGRLVADSEGVAAAGQVSRGAITYLATSVVSISGPVSYDGGVVQASLSGRTLGGPVDSEIEVNVPARHWEGTARGTPGLAEFAAWLSDDGPSTDVLDIEGSAYVEVEASGWSSATVSGRGSGGGSVLDIPLEDLLTSFAYSSATGTTVEASAILGGGPLVLTLRPQGGTGRMQLAGRGVEVSEGLEAEWDVSATLAGDGTRANLVGGVRGTVGGRTLDIEADGLLDSDGLQLFVSGSDDQGASIEGAVVVAGGNAEGQVAVTQVSLPGFYGPVDLALRGDGSLASLPIELELSGQGSSPATFGLAVQEEFGGMATAVLTEGEIRDVIGAFGPLSFTGSVDLAPLGFRGEYLLDDLQFEGRANGSFGSSGAFSFDSGGLRADGRLRLQRLAAGGAELGPLTVDFQAARNESEEFELAFASRGPASEEQAGEADPQEEAEEATPRLSGRLTGSGVSFEVDRPPLTLADRPVSLEGTLSLPYGGFPRADVTARSEELLVRLQPGPEGHLVRVNASPGLDLGGFTLRQPLEAGGSLDMELSRGDLQGTIAGTPFLAQFERTGNQVVVDSSLGEADDAFRISYDAISSNWGFSGDLLVEPLARALGLPLNGRVQGDLQRGPQGYAGGLRVDGAAAGIPLDLLVAADEERLALSGSATTAGIPWQLSGTSGDAAGMLLPAISSLAIQATSEHGSLLMEGIELSGSGRLPGDLGPLSFQGAGWRLAGDLAANRVTVSTGTSDATLDWRAGAVLQADLQEELNFAGLPAQLVASVDWRPGTRGEIAGTLELSGQPLALSGDLDQLQLNGVIDAPGLSRSLFGTPLLAGTLELDSAIPLSDPTTAVADFRLSAGGSTLTGRAEGNGGEWRADLSGTGLEAEYRQGRLSVRAEDAAVGPFLPVAGSELSADGSLGYSRQDGWQGEMMLLADLPLPGEPDASIRLLGSRSDLTVRGQLDGDFFQARATGTLLPALDLSVEASALGGNLVLAGTADGALSTPVFEGVLTSQQLEYRDLALPALSLAVSADAESGVRVSGEPLTLSMTGEGLSGSADLGVSVAGLPHRLGLAVRGTPGEPRVDLTLSGPAANGSGSWGPEGGRLALDVDPHPWLPEVLAGRGPASIGLSVHQDLTWDASLSAPLEFEAEPLHLEGVVSGSGSAYDGSLRLSHADYPESEASLVEAEMGGQGTTWSATADMGRTDSAALGAILPVEGQLQPSGTLRLASDLVARVDGGLTGTLSGQSLDLSLSGDSLAGVKVQGSVSGAGITALARSDGLDFTVTEPAAEGVELGGTVGWAETFTLSLSGRAAGRELRANGQYDPGSRSGQLEASLAAALLTVTARPAEATPGEGVAGELTRPVAITADLDNTLAEPLYTPFRAQARLLASQGSLVVEDLVVDGGLPSQGESWHLAAAGPIWPEPSLGGDLEVTLTVLDAPLEAAVALTGASLAQPQLLATADGVQLSLGRDAAGWRAGLSGNGLVAGLVDTAAALSWAEQHGFAGSARLGLAAGTFGGQGLEELFAGAALEVSLEGEGGLRVSPALLDASRLSRRESAEGDAAGEERETPRAYQPLASGELLLSPRPWEDRSLAGELRFSGELGRFWPGYPGEPLALSGQLELAGTITDPTATGQLALAGAIDAGGRLEFANGRGSVAVEGQELTLNAEAGIEGSIDSRIAARSLDLTGLWPSAGGTLVDLEAVVARSPAGALSGVVRSFSARRGGSLVEGSARLGESLAAELSLDLDLEDLPLPREEVGGPHGSLQGSLTLAASGLDSIGSGTLRGALRLEQAGWAGSYGVLSGSIEVAGAASDPLLHLALEGSGRAEGRLLIDARPASGELSVDSDLNWGEVRSDIRVEAERSTITASGRIELPGGHFTLSSPPASEAAGDSVLFEGGGSYREWLVRLHPEELTVELEADVSSLGDGVSGRIAVRAGGDSEAGQWLEGEASDLAWGELRLGDVVLTSESPGAAVLLRGSRLEATIRPAGGPSWQVGRLALELPNGVQLTASGSGSGSSGSAEVIVAGEIGGAAASLPLHLERVEDGPLTIVGSGNLLDGDLSVDAVLNRDGWQGTVTADGLEVSGASADAEGRLGGRPLAPQLTLDASAEGELYRIEASSLLSPATRSLEARLTSRYLSQPIMLRADAGPARELVLESGDSRLSIRTGAANEEAVIVNGRLALGAGPLRLSAQGVNGTGEGQGSTLLELQLTTPELPGLTLATTLTARQLSNPITLLDEPLRFNGRDGAAGELLVSLSPLSLTSSDLSYSGKGATIAVAGSLGPGLRAQVTGVARLHGTSTSGLLPTLPPRTELPFELSLGRDELSFLSEGDLGSTRLVYDLASGAGSLSSDLRLNGGAVTGEVDFIPDRGPSGQLQVTDLPLVALVDQEPLRLSGTFDVSPEAIALNAQLRAAAGSLLANGTVGLGLLLPTDFAPQGSRARRVELQLGTFDLSTVPWVAERLPYLSAPLSGFLQVLGTRVVGRLVAPDLAVAGDPLPLSIDISGSDQQVVLSGLVAGSPLQVTVDQESIAARATWEQFPLHLLAQAATGPLDVSAEVTGVGRLVLPWGSLEGLVIEAATELVRLERAGVVTTGNVSLSLAAGELSVNEARFSGAGNWQAQGTVRRDLLDLSLSATEADFGPLLGLVPLLARYEAAARGSLELRTSGSLDEPVVTLTTPSLDFEVAGSSYRLTNGEATLRDELLSLAAIVTGIEPFTGQLEVSGSGELDLLPPSLGDARFTVLGEANVPGLGAIQAFQATMSSEPTEPLRLEGSGRLGQPFTLAGTLVPLDLTLRGNDLAIRLPYLLLSSALVDADLRLQWAEALEFSGSLGVDQALFELGIRPPPTGERDGPNPVVQQVVFDSIAIDAPGRVRFMENFGSAETALSLTLEGTAAQPALTGTARVLRGTIRFSGRDFTITSAQARFDPSRGVLPILEVTAVTSFDMDQVVPAGAGVRFVAPQEGSRFEVTLSFTGELESTPGATPPFRLDLSPALSSQALIQEVREDGTSSAPRPLSEPELLSLVTLGRLDLEAPLAGEAGLAAAVAEGAIDTAVDLLLVSELQNALAEALGVDLVEINTTSLSSIFGRSPTEPFSVSLRLGGYLSDEVFASYRIGTFDDVQGLYALTNEVNLIYELGPVEFDLAGRVNIEDTAIPTPDAEVSATLRYDFNPLTAIEGGVDLSDDRQQVRFGVTLRW